MHFQFASGLRCRWGLSGAFCAALFLGGCGTVESIASFGDSWVLPAQDDVTETNFQSLGNVLIDMLGFERRTIASGWSAEVIFLMEDGRVVYKVLQGKPRIEEVHDNVSPLSPLQDIGGTAVGFGKSMLKM